MRFFLKLAVGLLVVGLFLGGLAYFSGPKSVRDSAENQKSPVGQLATDQNRVAPNAKSQGGSDPVTGPARESISGSTENGSRPENSRTN